MRCVATRELPIRQRGVWRDVPVPAYEGWAAETSELLKALADPTRLSMVASLKHAAGAVCICDFTAAFGLSQPTISHHMAKLRVAGLVESHRHGVWVYYRLREDISPLARRLLESLLIETAEPRA
jgi:ArsR family transcriptional regulator, arsenate/arsenite/antimonite-responsive transcriptional repressor